MPVSPNSRTSTHAAGLRSTESPRFARSGQMVRCLRDERLYSEKRARDTFFAVIEKLLSSDPAPAIIVARLTREASRLARVEAERAGYEFSNWNNAGHAVVKALLCSESLRTGDGQPIPFGVGAHAAFAASLCDDYQDRTEAFLLEFLLRRLGDVTLRDHTALAHALFRQFDPGVSMNDLEDRVAILFARLAHCVVLDGDTYVVRDADAAASVPAGTADTAAQIPSA